MRLVIGRLLIGLTVATAALAAGVEPSSAQNRPWCLRTGFSGPGWCGYDSYAQCYESARGQGGSCIENIEILWERRYGKQKRDTRKRKKNDDWGYNWR
jgi:hypothetical protein